MRVRMMCCDLVIDVGIGFLGPAGHRGGSHARLEQAVRLVRPVSGGLPGFFALPKSIRTYDPWCLIFGPITAYVISQLLRTRRAPVANRRR